MLNRYYFCTIIWQSLHWFCQFFVFCEHHYVQVYIYFKIWKAEIESCLSVWLPHTQSSLNFKNQHANYRTLILVNVCECVCVCVCVWMGGWVVCVWVCWKIQPSMCPCVSAGRNVCERSGEDWWVLALGSLSDCNQCFVDVWPTAPAAGELQAGENFLYGPRAGNLRLFELFI